MPSNIEIKAHARGFKEMRSRAEQISDTSCEVLHQEDTFFTTPKGRLKLRELQQEPAQLIYYERPDQDGPKRSNYHLFLTEDPENLKMVLKLAYGIRGVVRKTRYLYISGQTRIHLDDVEGLGHFMELEVMLKEGQSDQDGERVARDLMNRLGVEQADLLEGAYMDMIENSDQQL